MSKQPKKVKELIRVERYIDYKVLIVEDQPVQLTQATANELFAQYAEVKEIHELHVVWGGRWSREVKSTGVNLEAYAQLEMQYGHAR